VTVLFAASVRIEQQRRTRYYEISCLLLSVCVYVCVCVVVVGVDAI